MKALPKPGTDPEYFYWLKEWASHNSDGCTKVPDVYVICCYQHDFGCRMGFDPRFYYRNELVVIGKVANATLLRQCFIESSKLHHLSPLAWIFWSVLISPFGAGVNKQWWLEKAPKA